MNSGPPEQLPQCFLNLNWDHVMGAGGHLQTALGSIVSSSQSSNSHAAANPADSLAFHKLVGGLHVVANSGEEISPQSHFVGAPMNSPPKLNLSMMGGLYQHHQAFGGLPMPGHQMLPSHLDHFSNDPGFADRAARFSSFDGQNYGGQVAAPETGRLSRAPSSKSLTTSGLQIGLLPEVNKEMNNEVMNAREESSVSDPICGEVSMVGPPGSNGKKRKAPPKGKGKDVSLANPAVDPPKTMEEDKSCSKRSRTEGGGPENDSAKQKVEQNDGASTSENNGGSKQGKDNNKPPEPPKDYIHVRARRGQATDSHSLAERVRREKISQRMKLLQDLVPGCNKVTGKAVMLDEIINYVQSLQRQVEFLSMKLATVNPRLDFNNLANLLPKDIHQTCGSMPNSVYTLEASGMQSSFANQPQSGNSLHCSLNNGAESQNSLNLLDSSFHQSLGSHQPFLNGLENPSSQLGNFWEDDLQSVVQMDIGQGQELAASSQSFHGPLPTGHMKIEL